MKAQEEEMIEARRRAEAEATVARAELLERQKEERFRRNLANEAVRKVCMVAGGRACVFGSCI